MSFPHEEETLRKLEETIGDVAGLGLALRIEVTEADRYTPNKALVDAIVESGLRGKIPTSKGLMGLVLDVGGYYKNVLTLAPLLETTRGD